MTTLCVTELTGNKICSITLDFLNFDLLLSALGSGGDKGTAASASARSVKDQESSLSMVPHTYSVRANLLSDMTFLVRGGYTIKAEPIHTSFFVFCVS